MGLEAVRMGSDPFIGGDRPSPLARGRTLLPADVISALSEAFPGFHGDVAGRLDMYQPQLDRFQGLWFGVAHICSMDREPMRQWPEWSVEEELVEVPISEAVLHDDLPIVALNSKGEPELLDQDTAMVFRMKPDRCVHVGWAEVFYRVCNSKKYVDVSPQWVERQFGVSMDWIYQMKNSPMFTSFEKIDQRTGGERKCSIAPTRKGG